MDYKAHYDRLIERARNRDLPKPYERHHAIPKCLGGSNEKSNLVSLTYEEHYTAHLLLVKIYPNNIKLVKAVKMMTTCNGKQLRNNKEVGWVKRLLATANAYSFATGKPSKLRGIKKGPQSAEIRAKVSASKLGKKRAPFSDEWKKKIGAAQRFIPKGPQSPEHIAKAKAARLGITYSKKVNLTKAAPRCSCIICKKETNLVALIRFHKH